MRVYLDNSATTSLDKRVLEKMTPYLLADGNASSLHSYGREAQAEVDRAREEIASLVGCSAKEVYFTSGGTESDNWALRGVASALSKEGKHIVTTKIEHPAVLNTCAELQRQGYQITYVGVGADGRVSVEDVKKAVREDTILVSVMFANNEMGAIQPIEEIGAFCREEGIPFHTDAVQAMGSIKIDVKKMNVDLLSFSSHKFHGPKGIGILYIRDGIKCDRLLFGGEQERGRRAGTTNTPAIVGTAEALRLAVAEMEENNRHIKAMRDHFIDRVLKEIPACKLNGGTEHRLVGNANISFDYIEGESILMTLDLNGIAVSSGSACSSGSLEPSHVILALGRKEEEAHSSIRFSFGRENTMEETDYVVDVLKETIQKLRSWSPLFQAKEGESTYV